MINKTYLTNRHWRISNKVKGFLTALIIALCFIFIVTMRHWFLRLPFAKVIENGRSTDRFAVYRSLDGTVLLLSSNMPYVFLPNEHEVSLVNRSNFLVSGGLVFLIHADQGGVDLNDFAKTGVVADVVVKHREFDFTDGSRIRVNW